MGRMYYISQTCAEGGHTCKVQNLRQLTQFVVIRVWQKAVGSRWQRGEAHVTKSSRWGSISYLIELYLNHRNKDYILKRYIKDLTV